MREFFNGYLCRSQEDMRGYIQNDVEALSESRLDELEKLVLQYDAQGCSDPLAWALSDIYGELDRQAQPMPEEFEE